MKKSSPNVGLVYCWSIEIDENDKIIQSIRTPGANHEYQGRVTDQMATGCFIETPSSVLVKRSCLEAMCQHEAELLIRSGDDWPMYFILSQICEFAVIPEYLVGYRQSPGSLSRDVSVMAKAMDDAVEWLTERWPSLPDDLKKKRAYDKDIYLARRALDNNQFSKALYYQANAYKTDPAGLLKSSSFLFLARLLFRMTGLTRAKLSQQGWAFRRPTYFPDAMKRIKQNP